MSSGGLNGRGFTGPQVNPPAGQLHPGAQLPDHRDAEGVASPSANTRIVAITGIVVGLVPLLSIIGLILSIVALVGYRRVGGKPTLAVVGIVVSVLVLTVSGFYLLPAIISG